MPDSRGPWTRFSDFMLRNVVAAMIIPTATAAVSMIIYVNNVDRDIKDIKQWQKDYVQFRTDKLQELKETFGKQAASIDAVNARVDRISEKVSGMDFQLTTTMANVEQLKTANDKINDSLNKLTSDVRLAVEILNRLDEKRRADNSQLGRRP